jgi:hypothetical protein
MRAVWRAVRRGPREASRRVSEAIAVRARRHASRVRMLLPHDVAIATARAPVLRDLPELRAEIRPGAGEAPRSVRARSWRQSHGLYLCVSLGSQHPACRSMLHAVQGLRCGIRARPRDALPRAVHRPGRLHLRVPSRSEHQARRSLLRDVRSMQRSLSAWDRRAPRDVSTQFVARARSRDCDPSTTERLTQRNTSLQLVRRACVTALGARIRV